MALKNNIEKGRFGEETAKNYLINSGWEIIETNWHFSKNAEVDIIAVDKGTIVFVEVKTRSTLNFGHPFESINPNKIRKIRTAISGYLQKSEKKYKSYRIDAIAVIGTSNPKIEHLRNCGQY